MTKKPASTWAIDAPATRSAGYVLAVLARYRNRTTGACYPSVETICQRTGYSRACVQAALKELEKQGLISIQTSKGRVSNRYTLNMETDTWL